MKLPETQIWNASRKVLKLNHTLLQTVLWTLATTAAKFANMLVLTLFISYLYVWFYVSSSFCPIWFLLSWFPYLGIRFFSQWLCPVRFFPSVTILEWHSPILECWLLRTQWVLCTAFMPVSELTQEALTKSKVNLFSVYLHSACSGLW